MDADLRQMSKELDCAYIELNEACDKDLTDIAIHKITSIELKINHYLKQKKVEEPITLSCNNKHNIFKLNGVKS